MDDKQDKRETLFEKHRENIYFRWGLTAFIVILACVIASQFVTKLPAFVSYVKSFLKTLSPVLYGLGIAYLLHPIVDRVQLVLEPRFKKRMEPRTARKLARSIGIFAALLVVVIILWALLSLVLPQLVESISTIIRNMPSYYNTISSWVTNLVDDTLAADVTENVMTRVYNYLNTFLTDTLLPKLQTLLTTVTSSLIGLAKSLLNLVIGVIISVYLLSGRNRFLAQAKKLCYAVLGVQKGGYFCNICTYANRVFGGFISGSLTDSLCVGILCFIGMRILNLSYPMLIALIVGCTNIIPFFGPYIGAVPSALLLLVVDPMQCLKFVIFVLVLQQIDGNIVAPRILGDATGLDSIWVVISLLIFGNLFGVLGMVIAVPTFAVFYKILTEVINYLLKRRGLSLNTIDYARWNYPPRHDVARWNPVSRRQKNRKKRQMKKDAKAAAEAEAAEKTEADASAEPDEPDFDAAAEAEPMPAEPPAETETEEFDLAAEADGPDAP